MTRNATKLVGLLVSAIMVASTLAGCAQPTPAPAPKAEQKADVKPAESKAAESKPAAEAKPKVEPAKSEPAKAAEPAKPAAPIAQSVTIVMSQEPDTLLQGIGAMTAAAHVKHALGTEISNAGQAVLVWRNDKNEIIPGIAESVPTLENGGARYAGDGENKRLEVTYKLRKNVKWHDSQPVTSADVKFEWETVMNPDYPITDRSSEKKIAAIDTPDDYTVVVKFLSQKEALEASQKGRAGLPKEEYSDYAKQAGPVTDALYNRVPAVMPKHVYGKVPVKDLSKSEYARKPIGMGPYKLKEWVAGQSLTLEANPDYFLGAPKIKTVIFKIVPDTNAIIAQLQAGQVDVITSDAFQPTVIPDLDRITSTGVMKPYYVPGMAWEHIDFNLDHEFLQDARVRKAIAHAIDRKAINQSIMGGKAPAMHTWIPLGNLFADDNVTKYEYSKDKAKQLLQEAGFKPGADGVMAKDGKPLKLLLQSTAGNAARELTSQIIQQQLKDVGIGLNLDLQPSRNFFAPEGQGPVTGRTFQIAMFGWQANDDPGGESLWLTRSIPSKENNFSGQNLPGWKNAKADELLIKANSSLVEKERKEAYSQHQKLFAEDLPVLPLYQRLIITVARANLKNYKPTPTLTPSTWNIWEWEMPAR